MALGKSLSLLIGHHVNSQFWGGLSSLLVTASLVSDSALDFFEGCGQPRVVHRVHVLLGDYGDVFIHLLEWFPGTLGLVVPLSPNQHLDRLAVIAIAPVVDTLDQESLEVMQSFR